MIICLMCTNEQQERRSLQAVVSPVSVALFHFYSATHYLLGIPRLAPFQLCMHGTCLYTQNMVDTDLFNVLREEASKPLSEVYQMDSLDEARAEISRLRKLLATYTARPSFQYYHDMTRYIVTRANEKPRHKGPRQLQLQESNVWWELRDLKGKVKLSDGVTNRRQRITCTAKLCSILRESGKLDVAEREARLLLVECINSLPKHHGDIVAVAVQLASVLCAQEKFFQARQLAQWGLASSWKVEGQHHPRTIIVLRVLGQIVRKQAETNQRVFVREEEKILRQVIKACHISFGPSNPETFIAVCNLSNFCCRYGQFKDAEDLLREHLASLPDDSPMRFHPIVLQMLHELIELIKEKKARNKGYDEVELGKLLEWKGLRSSIERQKLTMLASEWENVNTKLRIQDS